MTAVAVEASRILFIFFSLFGSEDPVMEKD
jgi:hypothetical protein